jgi:hypothetical protein
MGRLSRRLPIFRSRTVKNRSLDRDLLRRHYRWTVVSTERLPPSLFGSFGVSSKTQNAGLSLFRPLYFGMNESLADQKFFCIDNLIEAVGTEGAVHAIVPHLEQSPLAADGATAEARIQGSPY